MASSAEYMSAYSARRYVERKAWALELLGGQCVRCGGTEALQFVYRDRAEKEFSIGRRLNSAPVAVLETEIRKCRLVCRGCADRGVPHGGGRTGKRNCRCEPCRERKRVYMREFNQIRRFVARLNLKEA